jgi:hypothetical protein
MKEEINTSVKEATKPTYAQATIAPTSKPAPDPRILQVREQRNKSRQERAKCEVTLSDTTDDAKQKLLSMSYRDITEGIQTTINSNTAYGITVNRIQYP